MREEPEAIHTSDLLGIRRRSTGTIYALCPWHNERTPSLRIRDGRAKCFGCGETSDAIDDCAFGWAKNQLVLPWPGEPPTPRRLSLDDPFLPEDLNARHDR